MSPEPKTYDLTETRIFDAPIEEVWKIWTEPELVSQWWGPKGFTSPNPRIDFREGGVSLVSMHAPPEYNMPDLYNTWTYRTIQPPRRLEFVLHFTGPDGNRLDPAASGMPAGVPDGVLHEVTFQPLPGNRTEMTFIERGYTTREAHDLSRSGLVDVLDKMAALLESGSSGRP